MKWVGEGKKRWRRRRDLERMKVEDDTTGSGYYSQGFTRALRERKS
jgi:hypothetical protein